MYYQQLRNKIGDIPHKSTGNTKVKCPMCGDDHRGNRKDLSINYDEGVYNCHSASCNFKGSVVEFKKPVIVPIKQTNIKPFQTGPLTEEAKAFLLSRGITEPTIIKNKIAQSKDWICFNYYDSGEIVAAKYRHIKEKRFFQHAGCPATVYNLDGIKQSENAIICEGEFDSLSYSEIGIDFAVSVNQGAPNPNDENASGKLKCIENNEKHFKGKKKIFISVDDDAPGHRLESELITRFGRSKCFVIRYPEGCKDANDVLTKHGPEKLKECFENAKPLPVQGVITLDEVRDRMIRNYRHGVQKGETTRFIPLDPHFNWMRGDLNVFTGLPNMGKSEFVKFLMVLKSLYDGWKWAVFTPEHAPAENYYNELVEMVAGGSVDKNSDSYIKESEMLKAMDIVNDHFFFIYPHKTETTSEADTLHTPENIFETVKGLCLQKGIDGYLIDPWNQLTHTGMTEREDLYIASELAKLDRLNKEFNICGSVVAHPKRIPPDMQGNIRRPSGYDLSGGPMWMNKAYNMIIVHRDRIDGKLADETIIDVQKVKKQKLVGKPGEIEVRYSIGTGWYSGNAHGIKCNPMEDLSDIIMNRKKEDNLIENNIITRTASMDDVPF